MYGTPYEDEVNNFLNKPPPSPSDSKRELLQVDIVIGIDQEVSALPMKYFIGCVNNRS